MAGMHDYLGAAAQCAACWRSYYRYGAIFEHLVSLLESIDRRFQHLPFTLSRSHQYQKHISASREVGSIVVDNQPTELLLAVLNCVAQHVDDTFVDGIHLGMELNAGDAITQIDQGCRAIVTQHLIRRFGGCQILSRFLHGAGSGGNSGGNHALCFVTRVIEK